MISDDNGTPGISHTVHVGYPGEEGGVYKSIDEFENVVDAMDMPNGGVKLSSEEGMELISGARIIRTRVKGLDHSVRYRCSECESASSDVVAAMERGETTQMECPVCQQIQQFTKMGVEEV